MSIYDLPLRRPPQLNLEDIEMKKSASKRYALYHSENTIHEESDAPNAADFESEEQTCISSKQTDCVKRSLIIFCFIDMIIALGSTLIAYKNQQKSESYLMDLKRLIIDSIIILIISIFGLFTACFKICCHEIQSIIIFSIFTVFHVFYTIRLWFIDLHSNFAIDLMKYCLIVVAIILICHELSLIISCVYRKLSNCKKA